MTQTETVNSKLLKDDLYLAVNGEWLKTAKIPADKPQTGGFQDLADNIEKTLMHDFGEMLDGKVKVDNQYLNEFVKYYRLASDFEKRNREGFEPAKQYLKPIEELKDWDDWSTKAVDWTFKSYDAPVSLYVDSDMKNTDQYALYASVPSLILPDKTYYADDNQEGQALLQVFSAMTMKLFKLAGYDEKFAKGNLKRALKFDASMAPFQKDSTERADYPKMYNKYSFADFKKFSSYLDLGSYAEGLIKDTPEFVIVEEPKFYEALDQMINPETFENFKSWLLVTTLTGVTGFLSDEARVIGGEFSRAISGSKEAMKPQKAAYYLATNRFSQTVGLYYAHQYFGKQPKKDVEHMVHQMIDVYKERLENNTWLSEATRKQAIVKLDALGINVGYPEELDPLYKKFVVNENQSLLENALAFSEISIRNHFDRWGKPVDRTRWQMPAHMVNAYYDPQFNVIVFPAAILQAPFYSIEQSSSENYGGIGAVIAHEISHAFDNNGAQFDEKGNMHNWWTADDLKHFQNLAQDMIKEFDGLETEAGKVNGKLVVSENIADAGGLSCALEAAKKEADVDLKAFFINWARIWRMKASMERMKLLLNIDVHAPNVLRANVQPKNLDDFYTTFDIHAGDGMYLAPEKRVNIW